MSETRWFVNRDEQDNVYTVFKAEFDGNRILDEFSYWEKDAKWKPTEAISKWYFVGNDSIEEVSKEVAAENLPDSAIDKAADRTEIKTFIKFVNKSPKRPFEFTAVPELYAEVLNKFVAAKDYDSARRYAERYLQ